MTAEELKALKEALEEYRDRATEKKSDMFEDVLRMSKDPEGRAELLALVNQLKEEFMPLLSLIKEAVGEDLDNAIDSIIIWQARKTKVMYDAYVEEGFTPSAAIALTISAKASLAEALRNLG